MSDESQSDSIEPDGGAGQDTALSGQDMEEIKQATNIIKNFATAEKIYRLFPPSNVNVREAVGHFTSSLSIFFNKFQKPLKLKVTQTKFLYLNQPIYHNVEKDKSLSFRIYVDGVRAISFLPGSEEKEAKELMNVYLELSLIDPLENDFVSLFWERDFKLINILATDVFRDEDESEFSFERDFISSIEGGQGLGTAFAGEQSRQSQKKAAKAMEQSAEERELIQARADIFKFSEEERLTVQGYLQQEEKNDSLYAFIEIVFTLFSLDRDPAIFPNIVNVIGKTVRSFLQRYQFREAASLLKRVREFASGDDAGLNEMQQDTLRKMIRSLGDEQLLETVNQHLKNGDESEISQVFEFLAMLDPSVLPDIFDLIQNERFADRIVHLFAVLGAGQFDFFKNRIGEYNSEVGVLLLDVLAEIDIQAAMPIFIEKMQDPDPKLRSKCIKTLMKYDFPELKEIFKESVHDTNETNQMTALRYYNKHSFASVFTELATIFQQKGFLNEKIEKQQLIIGAMIKADLESSFNLLKKVLAKKSLFTGKKYQKFQKDILRTLSGLDSLEVAELLLRMYEDKSLSKGLREQCKVAISTIRSRTMSHE